MVVQHFIMKRSKCLHSRLDKLLSLLSGEAAGCDIVNVDKESQLFRGGRDLSDVELTCPLGISDI